MINLSIHDICQLANNAPLRHGIYRNKWLFEYPEYDISINQYTIYNMSPYYIRLKTNTFELIIEQHSSIIMYDQYSLLKSPDGYYEAPMQEKSREEIILNNDIDAINADLVFLKLLGSTNC